MKTYQYAEDMWFSRRMKMNSIFTLLTVCLVSVLTMATSLHAERTLMAQLDIVAVRMTHAVR